SALAIGQRINVDRPHVALEGLRIGQPLAIRGPRRSQVAVGKVVVLIHQDRLPTVEIDVPNCEAIVEIGNLLTVRRPGRIRVESWLFTQFELLYLSQAVLRSQVKRVLAGFIGEVGYGFAVRRPDRAAFVYAHRAGEVARIALFRRHGDDLAASGKHGPSSVGRDVRVMKLFGNIYEMRP